MRTITLRKGEIAFVDNDAVIPDELWAVNAQGYAAFLRKVFPGKNGRRWTFMHHFVLCPPKGFVVDHINGNKLDNRLENLRIASRQQNSFNRKKNKNNITGFTGVHFKKSRNKWYAKLSISVAGKRVSKERGYFSTKEEAAVAAKDLRGKFFGDFARL